MESTSVPRVLHLADTLGGRAGTEATAAESRDRYEAAHRREARRIAALRSLFLAQICSLAPTPSGQFVALSSGANPGRTIRTCVLSGDEIVFVRHGQPEWSHDGIARPDPSLTEQGRTQAKMAAERLAAERPITEILVSPATRSQRRPPRPSLRRPGSSR